MNKYKSEVEEQKIRIQKCNYNEQHRIFGDDKMEFRLARIEDLKQLKIMYKEIIKNMNKNNIQIWDDIYPCEFFEDDINNKRLYVIADDEEIISAFALCDNNAGEAYVEWSEKSAKAMYIDRLGVNVEYSKKGIGQQMLNKAKEISKSIGAEYLRLFVVDINKPAIRLYQKNGFTKVDGVYDEVFDDGYVLREIGYEIKL